MDRVANLFGYELLNLAIDNWPVLHKKCGQIWVSSKIKDRLSTKNGDVAALQCEFRTFADAIQLVVFSFSA